MKQNNEEEIEMELVLSEEDSEMIERLKYIIIKLPNNFPKQNEKY